jgi:hypothetical protein
MRKHVYPIETVDDLEPVTQLLNQIVGEVCWRAKVSYAEELYLDIGRIIPYKLGPHDRVEGTFKIATRGTRWGIVSLIGTLVTSEDEDMDDTKVEAIVNTLITAYDIDFTTLGLTITFENEMKFVILPVPEDDEWDLPYWELISQPTEQLIDVGPKRTWSYDGFHDPYEPDEPELKANR